MQASQMPARVRYIPTEVSSARIEPRERAFPVPKFNPVLGHKASHTLSCVVTDRASQIKGRDYPAIGPDLEYGVKMQIHPSYHYFHAPSRIVPTHQALLHCQHAQRA
jgi:hypothetical protein